MTEMYLSKLSLLKEDDFTKLILKPLFESMGYGRVDFHGGQYERGRDLIAQREVPPRKDPLIIYVQSKKVEDIQNVKEGVKFSTLLHQLRQCCFEKLKLIDGTEARADHIYLACPEKISSRLTEEIFSHLEEYKNKLTVYDGPQIIEDIKKYNPSLLGLLTSMKDKLASYSNDYLINSELLSALNNYEYVEPERFYSDLSFFVGSIDSNCLLHLEVDVSPDELAISNDEWAAFKKEVMSFKKSYGLSIISKSLDDVCDLYSKKLKSFQSKKNNMLISRINSLEYDISDLLNSIKISNDSLSAFLNVNSANRSSATGRKDSSEITLEILESISKVTVLEEIENIKTAFFSANLPPHIAKEVSNQIELKTDILNRQKEINKIKKNVIPEPLYLVSFNKSEIENKFKIIKSKYIEAVQEINQSRSSIKKISDFLFNIESELRFISEFVDHDLLCRKRIKIRLNKRENDRICISPHTILDTGFDVAVYGGAGVGKTTTLQVYARSKRRGDTVYVPLNRVLGKINQYAQNYEGRDYYKDELVFKSILISKNITPTNDNIADAKLTLPKNTVLILDGLDEIYSSVPEIINGIDFFKKSNPTIQIVISSRDCVSYLKDINFLGITLLPFTREQLERFIHGWFDCDKKASELINTVNEYSLFEHIKTPLLATITCSLMDKGVKIPASESSIYSERLKLLTGEYDKYKAINRQKQSGELLRNCAVAIAYRMQQSNIRMARIENIRSFLLNELSSHYQSSLLDKCLEELIDPCNVIVFDRVSDTYSFGHLRFQEHLASLRLKSDRSIEIISLTKLDWWRGTLGLYAQDSEISHLFEDIYKNHGNLTKSVETLSFMIENSPASKRGGLRHLFERYLESDHLDSIMDNLDDYDDGYGYSGYGY